MMALRVVKHFQLDVCESMLPFYEMGGIVSGDEQGDR